MDPLVGFEKRIPRYLQAILDCGIHGERNARYSIALRDWSTYTENETAL
jgi:hypothetical protein